MLTVGNVLMEIDSFPSFPQIKFRVRRPEEGIL